MCLMFLVELFILWYLGMLQALFSSIEVYLVIVILLLSVLSPPLDSKATGPPVEVSDPELHLSEAHAGQDPGQG